MLRRRSVTAGAVALAGLSGASLGRPALAQQKIDLQFWHGLTQPLGGMLEQRAADFNATQNKYQVTATFRGAYPETMVAAIAAFRAGTAPHIVQMFEVGTGTMIAAGRAIVPVHALAEQTGVNIGLDDYLPAIKGYYSLPDGRLMSLPFNSSTAIAYWNKDAFAKAGLDPDKFPETWPALAEAARKLKAAGIAMPMSTSWPTWVHVEQLSAIHNIPLATLANGFEGLGAELRINNPLVVRHIANLVEWQKEGLFRYGGRDSAGDGVFPSGDAAISFASSGTRARIVKEARFAWGAAMLPYYPDVQGAPINSIIGGASLWVMQGGPNKQRSADELRGVAEFFRYMSQPEVAAKWHQETGYLPVSQGAYQATRASGFYAQNPYSEVAVQQMLRGGGNTTENSKGIRLGGFAEIRNIMQEELERALQGQQTAEQAMANSQTRGNVVLRNFERANRG
ncbi:sn-glycerol-3-phosphate ABC transporter substrate-binding protein UgpB [Roseomonas sp. OT10]|uniref:sn-glycerol-3-phosphate ABC transporter substrate-binding protein UgpB n=1 Tax=Roseomonas cutis TaxID=2897332 RepID=UPI001E489B77|nr:sn-glycerol-3-phosphate ABC transporter substrate-binding protein UgpB [Roseomonas sp. OT10]UFN49982.1 sn-glycerol-3-phosphate ABC transporter substrate-binding protein UgpB [Roseomonas sp. OT10]